VRGHAGIAATLLALACACGSPRAPADGHTGGAFAVVSAVERGSVIDVRLDGFERLRFFLPGSPGCRVLARPGARFRDNVPEAFALVAGERECPVEGFVRADL